KGMYWKSVSSGYYWYQAPIETQALMIEAFQTIGGDAGVVRDLKTWLLRQKQTHSWATTRATADAVYALLLNGEDWLAAERKVDVRLGDKNIDWGAGEAGTGYNKKVFDGPFVNPGMGNITVTMKSAAAAAGSGAGAKGAGGGTPTVASAGAGGGSPAWGGGFLEVFDMVGRG